MLEKIRKKPLLSSIIFVLSGVLIYYGFWFLESILEVVYNFEINTTTQTIFSLSLLTIAFVFVSRFWIIFILKNNFDDKKFKYKFIKFIKIWLIIWIIFDFLFNHFIIFGFSDDPLNYTGLVLGIVLRIWIIFGIIYYIKSTFSIELGYYEKEAKDFLVSFVIALIIVIPFRHFVAEPYIVQGASMSPNYETGDYIIVNKFVSYLIKPERGDVLVFVPPKERKTSWKNFFPIIDKRVKYIKRVVGLPGETVRIKENSVWIKKPDQKEFIKMNEFYLKNHRLRRENTITLKDDEYFMLGDNRGNSSDSEEWGPIKYSDILGEPVLRLLPFNKFGFNPAKEKFNF